MIHKCHLAKISQQAELTLWGTGTPRREFLYVDDLADACLFLMNHYDAGDIINVGLGQDLTLRELARIVAKTVGFRGRLIFDPTYPDGTPRKLLDVNRLTQLGWRAQTPLGEGLKKSYEWFTQSSWVQKDYSSPLQPKGGRLRTLNGSINP